MGNNVACKVVRIDTIQIKIHDDIIRTFTNVRHIPKLNKNLISQAHLDSNGYTYTAKGGVIKISKGAFIVMQ